MARVRRAWILVTTVAALALLVPVVAVTLLSPWSDAQAEETTTSLAQDGQKSLPTEPSGDVQAAPAESGGEPFRTCEGCHTDYESKPGTAGDLIFSHPTHLKQDIKCATCHEPPLGHFSAPAPMMMTCLSCHQGETAPNDCKNCHRKLEEVAPGVDEPVVHLEPDVQSRRTCEKCHDVDTWCEQCHGVVMPHPANWQAQHTQAARNTAQACEKCHQSRDKTFCIRCHGVEMPHPAYWYSGHGDVARSSGDSCGKCHPPKAEFCDQCHHAGYEGQDGWTSAHGDAANSAGPAECLVCHEQRFCAQCHEAGRFVKQ